MKKAILFSQFSLYFVRNLEKSVGGSLSTTAKMTKERMWNMHIKLSVHMIVLALALLLVVVLLVGIAALHAAHSVTWHTFALSPDILNHD